MSKEAIAGDLICIKEGSYPSISNARIRRVKESTLGLIVKVSTFPPVWPGDSGTCIIDIMVLDGSCEVICTYPASLEPLP